MALKLENKQPERHGRNRPQFRLDGKTLIGPMSRKMNEYGRSGPQEHTALMSDIEQAARRLDYYIRNFACEALPQSLFRKRLERLCADYIKYDVEYLRRRLNYYNKLTNEHSLVDPASSVGKIPVRPSRYYYDLMEHARYFPRDFGIHHVFGDVTHVPDEPGVVKSRPIAGENRNSVLMNLDKFRHFRLFRDRTAFLDKLPKAVWRGSRNNAKRQALVTGYHHHVLCDVGWGDGERPDRLCKPFLSPVEQMRYRYVISVEGNDVATNLKWVMASNSLCMMPSPTCETWFMEGTLQPGIHYVQLRPDFADLEEKIRYYEQYPDKALEIVCNANAYVKQFLDQRREQLLSLLVLSKYFSLTRQLMPKPKIAALWADS